MAIFVHPVVNNSVLRFAENPHGIDTRGPTRREPTGEPPDHEQQTFL